MGPVLWKVRVFLAVEQGVGGGWQNAPAPAMAPCWQQCTKHCRVLWAVPHDKPNLTPFAACARDTATIHINREEGFTPGEKPAPCREDGAAQGVLCCALNREGLMLPGLGCLAE